MTVIFAAELKAYRSERLRRRPRGHARHHLLGRQAHRTADRVLGRRARDHRLPERLGDRRRLHVGVVVPRLRGPDLPVRRRRLRRADGGDRGVRPGAASSSPSGCATPASSRSPTCCRSACASGRAARPRRSGRSRSSSIYLLAQMVGAGALIQALTGVELHAGRDRRRRLHARLRDLRRHARHDVGPDHQGDAAHGVRRGAHDLRAREGGLQPGRAVQSARERSHDEGAAFLEPGLQFDSGLALLSFGIAFVFGTAGLPHILMRFFTVPDARAARGSVGWAVFLIGTFYLMVMFVGVGARALLTPAEGKAAGETGNLAVPELAQTSAAARAPRAATSSWRSSRRSRWRRSSRSWPAS